ncbi:hypothetical protein P0Y31_17380 [Knoellia sp. 3-2P3]|uniref:hypothetical protein n=1 Tax=unclassified Knoellia TaxID=2618719 RepID=UPI0023DAA979|nr:hypothetical protein [Knoellia sp. 3-2P3]MDF2094124.1 hypothetical protein [Knoellia sp. 3-2P3]
MTDDTKPLLGSCEAAYLEDLEGIFTRAASDIDRQAPIGVELRCASGWANHSINRRLRKRLVIARRPQINAFVNGPNDAGPTDERVHALYGVSGDGDLIFALWNYACHPVGHPVRDAFSAHFPHVVREHLRTLWSEPRLPVLFFQGFSGDVRPSGSVELVSLRRRLRRIIVGPIFDDMSIPSYMNWAGSLAARVADLIGSDGRAVAPARISVKRVTLPSERFVDGALEPVSFHSIHIGDTFSIVGVSAEVVCEYGEITRKHLPGRIVANVGCIDHPFGYAPTAKMLEEGGYEAGGYCRTFSLGNLNADVENSMIDGLAQVTGLSPVSASAPGRDE